MCWSWALFTWYWITYVSDRGFVYTALLESDTLCSNNPIQLCSPSAGGAKMDPAQSVPFCFTCKHHNLIQNSPKPRFENRMASVQVRLINCLANGQRNNKYGECHEITLIRNSVTWLFSRLHLNTHTPERCLYQIQESDLAWKVIRYPINQA